MISQTALTVIRGALPVIGSAIGDITPIFYERMFTARPDLLRDLFNRGHPRSRRCLVRPGRHLLTAGITAQRQPRPRSPRRRSAAAGPSRAVHPHPGAAV